MVMSWKYWACLALTGAAVVLVFGEPCEWLNGYQWWTQFALQKAAGAAFAVAAWKVGKGLFNEWEEESLGKEPERAAPSPGYAGYSGSHADEGAK